MQLIGDWLVRTSVEGSILITVALGLSWLLGRHLAPRWRVTLWALVGCKLLIPAFLPTSPGLGNWLRPETAAETSAVILTQGAEQVELDEPVVIPAEVVLDPLPALTPIVASTLTSPPLSMPVFSRGLLLFSLWLAGVAGFVAIVFFRQRRFASRSGLARCLDHGLLEMVREVAEEHGVRGDVRVLLTPEGSTPAVYGAWRSALLLPRDWKERFDPDTLTYIVRHEIEHIRYRDVLLNWVAAAVNAIHWFNPLVWVAVSRFQSDRELRCDADTLSRLNPTERIDYGRTLLRVQKEFLPAPAIAGVAPCVRNHPTLHQRIIMITNPAKRKSWLNAILVLGFAGLILVSFGSAKAEEERSPREGDRREGDKPRPDSREGDKPGPDSREGDRPRPEGDRPEGDKPRGEGDHREMRDGDKPRGEDDRRDFHDGGKPGQEGRRPEMHEGDLRVVVLRDGVLIGDRKVPFERLREELGYSQMRGAIISAQPDLPFHQVNAVVMALRGSGIHDVRFGGIEGGDRRMPGEGGRPMPQGGPRDGDKPRPEGAFRDGDKPRPEGGPRDGDKPRPEGGPRDGDKPRPEGGPRDGDKPRPEGAFRDGDKPRPEGGPRDGDKPRPEGDPRDGDKPRPEGGPRDGDKPAPTVPKPE